MKLFESMQLFVLAIICSNGVIPSVALSKSFFAVSQEENKRAMTTTRDEHREKITSTNRSVDSKWQFFPFVSTALLRHDTVPFRRVLIKASNDGSRTWQTLYVMRHEDNKSSTKRNEQRQRDEGLRKEESND